MTSSQNDLAARLRRRLETDHQQSEEAAASAMRMVEELCAQVEVPTLAAWGVDREAFRRAMPKMARDALASGSPGNNPRLATEAEIVELYEQVISL